MHALKSLSTEEGGIYGGETGSSLITHSSRPTSERPLDQKFQSTLSGGKPAYTQPTMGETQEEVWLNRLESGCYTQQRIGLIIDPLQQSLSAATFLEPHADRCSSRYSTRLTRRLFEEPEYTDISKESPSEINDSCCQGSMEKVNESRTFSKYQNLGRNHQGSHCISTIPEAQSAILSAGPARNLLRQKSSALGHDGSLHREKLSPSDHSLQNERKGARNEKKGKESAGISAEGDRRLHGAAEGLFSKDEEWTPTTIASIDEEGEWAWQEEESELDLTDSNMCHYGEEGRDNSIAFKDMERDYERKSVEEQDIPDQGEEEEEEQGARLDDNRADSEDNLEINAKERKRSLPRSKVQAKDKKKQLQKRSTKKNTDKKGKEENDSKAFRLPYAILRSLR